MATDSPVPSRARTISATVSNSESPASIPSASTAFQNVFLGK